MTNEKNTGDFKNFLHKRAAEITGQSTRTLEDYKRMSEAFEITLRNVELTYNHHKETASVKQIADDDGTLHLTEETDRDKITELPFEISRRCENLGICGRYSGIVLPGQGDRRLAGCQRPYLASLSPAWRGDRSLAGLWDQPGASTEKLPYLVPLRARARGAS